MTSSSSPTTLVTEETSLTKPTLWAAIARHSSTRGRSGSTLFAAVVVAAAAVVVAADARKPKRIEMVSHISSFPPQSRLHFRNGGFTSNWKRTSWASKSKTKTKTNIG